MINFKKIWDRLLPGVVVIAVVVVFFVVFMINNNKHIVTQNGKYVSDAVTQTASRISDDMETAVRTLSTFAEICDTEEDNTYPEDLKHVDDTIFSMIDYIAVEDSDDEGFYYGTLYAFRDKQAAPGEAPDRDIPVTTNPGPDGIGATHNGAEYIYVKGFDLGMNTDGAGMREEFSQILGSDGEDNKSMLSFYAAKHGADGKKLGVLIGRYDEERVKDTIAAKFFDEDSGVYLLNAEGNILTTTDVHLYTDGAEEITNIFEILQNVDTSKSFEELEESFLKGEKVSFSFTSSGGTVNACFMQLPLHTGVSADNWIILQTFPATVTSQMQWLTLLEGLQLGLGLVLALALYIAIIIFLNFWQNRKLVKENKEMTYVVEGLANLYDRFVYVNLNEKKYRYVGDTYPQNNDIPPEGDYDNFKNSIIATFRDSFDKTNLAQKLEISEIISEMSDGTSELRYEYRTGKDGIRWNDLSLICLSRDNGNAKEVLFARQNISELKEKELHNQVVLKEAFRAAEDANRAKSDFLSSMSHDIRTPMNAVLGFSSLMENSATDPEKVTEYSKKIQAAGQHLLGLINEILDMSKIESGKFTITVSEFKMSELLDEVNSVIIPQANLKNQTYNINTDGLSGENYLGDKLRISQILINILSNAVKYTPDGGTIDFVITSGDKFSDNIYNIVFTISDNGIGMSEEYLTRLYVPFEREVNSMTGKTQGTGLGMAITKNLVDLMGGSIEVQSKQGVGTTFTVTLQLLTAENAGSETPLPQHAPAGNPLKGMMVLVAEDNEINAEILSELLEISGAKCEVAENGKIAVEKFVQSKVGEYDMILMDIQMPVMDGYEASRAIRSSSHPSAQTVPILAMTANTFADDVKNAMNAGMNAHIGKPVSLDVLKATVIDLKITKR